MQVLDLHARDLDTDRKLTKDKCIHKFLEHLIGEVEVILLNETLVRKHLFVNVLTLVDQILNTPSHRSHWLPQ